jgi:hypothetical protein
MNKEEAIFVFVGEFSYSLNWYAPWLRKQCETTFRDYNTTIFTYPSHEILYRDFIDKYKILPQEILNELKLPATFGQHINGKDITPSVVLDYINKVCPKVPIILPPHVDTFSQRPDGKYIHLNPTVKAETDAMQFLVSNNYTKDNTIVLMPKTRSLGGNAANQTWQKENWEDLVNRIINELDYNIISFYFKERNHEGGTYKLNIRSDKFCSISSLNLDEQIAFLRNTKYSIYGSTGANNIPFFCNTAMITFVLSQYGKRLMFDWQKKLTSNHKVQEIVLVENMKTFDVNDAFQKIVKYEENKKWQK